MRLVSTTDAARAIGCSRGAIYGMRDRGLLTVVQTVSGGWLELYDAEQVERVAAARRALGLAPAHDEGAAPDQNATPRSLDDHPAPARPRRRRGQG